MKVSKAKDHPEKYSWNGPPQAKMVEIGSKWLEQSRTDRNKEPKDLQPIPVLDIVL